MGNPVGNPVGAGWEWELKLYTYGNPGLTASAYNNVVQVTKKQENENSIRLLLAMNGLNTER